ncbi:50S ribosomal protein L17 [Candidatus Dependentiae bacterium]|nr:50S ribosomal protein L17 [Candidatus Dependentiae bacterium]
MRHLRDHRKLNLKSSHRKAYLRNQVIHLINYGYITISLAAAKEVRRFAEKMVTLALKGKDFNTIRRAKQLLPYSEVALEKLFADVAPQYSSRPGGYTRILKLGRRASDSAYMARLQWV